jgi:flagellar basal-body rod protein FlgC
MSGLFDTIGISGTGLTVDRKWMDAISDNLSNENDTVSGDQPAFATRYVEAQAAAGGGTEVTGIKYGDSQGILSYDPGNPLADKAGYVKHPDIDMSSQMTQMIMAERGYQANLQVISRATDAYQAALQLGKG